MSEEEKKESEQSNNESESQEEKQESSKKTDAELLYEDDKKSSKEKEESKDDPKEDEESENKESEEEDDDSEKKEKKEEEKVGKKKEKETEIEYDLKAPENSFLLQERIDEIAEYAKKHKISNEVAQTMIDRENEAVTQYKENSQTQLKNLVETEWPKEAKADKEIGGDKFPENVELAKRAFKEFGSDKFRQILNETGYGNHPEMIRTFSRIGRLLADDKLVIGKTDKPNKEKSTAEILYGGN